PGDVISLSYDGDSPVLTVSRAGMGSRTVKLSPTIRINETPKPIHTVPIDVIRPFLTRPMLVDENEMDNWPYIVSSYEQHLVSSPGIEIYVKGLNSDSDGEKYSIYRLGPEYVSHSSGRREVLGYESIYIADAEITAFGDPSTAIIRNAVKEVVDGDRLIIQSDDEIYTSFIPSSPSSTITGSIISAEGVLSEIGQYQVVVLDRGSNDGVEIGNVFGVYQSGVVVEDKVRNTKKSYEDNDLIDYLGYMKSNGDTVTLPDYSAGVIMVFRTFDRVSYGLVMEALGPIHLHDSIKSL
ncbi:MAG: peptidoglycan-binding protein, partial [Gammaproteobacteria bacterium]|nr:peptidoglycan-binding protein [Gammaproteobacteria bacterium]